MAGSSSRWLIRVTLVWAVLEIIMIASGWERVRLGRFGDPDDALRLIEVRDLLAGQGWFDLHQYRVDAPSGVLMHWSRLVDIPLAGTMLLLRPLLGVGPAETAALLIVPMITLLAVLVLVGRIAAHCFDDEHAAVATLLVGTAGFLLVQLLPNRIDHHGWQVVLALVALNGLMARDARTGGIVIGGALAALLTISIEGLPLTAVFLGVLALRGLTDPRDRFTGFAAAGVALAAGAALLFLATRGLGDIANHCDQVSPVHLLLLGWVGLAGLGLARFSPRGIAPGLVALAAIGLGGAAILLGAAPQCRSGAFSALDPLVRTYWYDNVAEGLPVWNLPAGAALTAGAVPLVGLLSALWLWWRAADPALRSWWRDYVLVLGAAWVIGVLVARASATACAMAAPATSALLLAWIAALRRATPLRRVFGYLAVVPVLLPAAPVFAWVELSTSNDLHPAATPTTCRYDQAGRALDHWPATDLFTPLDIGPDLLVHSHHRVVATGHHRAASAIHDVIAAFLASPDQARALIAAHHASLVVICADVNEPKIYADAAPNGLMARLLDDRAPSWLRPVPVPGHLRVWRVVNP